MLPEEIVPPRPVPPRPASSSPGKASGGKPAAPKVIEPPEPAAHPARPAMLRGFSKDGVIQILGGHSLPDGVFVKIIRE